MINLEYFQQTINDATNEELNRMQDLIRLEIRLSDLAIKEGLEWKKMSIKEMWR